jgi:hypothetical protein
MASELIKNRTLMQRLKEPKFPMVDFGLQSTGFEELITLPEPKPPEISRMEFDMKDKLVRQTIMTTQEDVKELKDDLDRIEEKIDKLN